MPGNAPQRIGASALERDNASQPISKIVIMGVVAFLLQAILAPNIAIGGISPNFFLVMLVPVCIISSQRTSIVAGFVFGLFFDLLGAGPVGAMSLVMAAGAYVLSGVLASVKLDRMSTWMSVCAVLALGLSLVFCIVVSIMGYEQSFCASNVFRVLPWTVYTLVAFAVAWPIYKKIAGVGRGLTESRIKL